MYTKVISILSYSLVEPKSKCCRM